jgi:hypothetical protein
MKGKRLILGGLRDSAAIAGITIDHVRSDFIPDCFVFTLIKWVQDI